MKKISYVLKNLFKKEPTISTTNLNRLGDLVAYKQWVKERHNHERPWELSRDKDISEMENITNTREEDWESLLESLWEKTYGEEFGKSLKISKEVYEAEDIAHEKDWIASLERELEEIAIQNEERRKMVIEREKRERATKRAEIRETDKILEKIRHGMNGKITHLNIKKKFGFIVSDNKDYYFNLNDVSSRLGLNIGSEVSFLKNEGHKGLYATDVEVTKASKSSYNPSKKTSNKMLVIGNTRIKKSAIKRYYSKDTDDKKYYIIIVPHRGKKIYECFNNCAWEWDNERDRDEALEMLDTEFR